MEAHAPGMAYAYDRAKQAMMLETDRPHRAAPGNSGVPQRRHGLRVGVYGGFIDKFPMGSVMNRSLTIRTGQCHVHRYMKPLLERIENGEIDPGFVDHSHDAAGRRAAGFQIFNDKQDDCIKIVLKPNQGSQVH